MHIYSTIHAIYGYIVQVLYSFIFQNIYHLAICFWGEKQIHSPLLHSKSKYRKKIDMSEWVK